MPIDTRIRPRVPATLPACRAVVAARVHAPEHAQRLFRALQIRNFAGELLDEQETIDSAARAAGIEPEELFEWERDPAVLEELEEDMRLARQPLAAARVLDHKLANWSGGRRYTCPSYELCRRSDEVKIAVPGFQPFAAYDVVTANLVPGENRRPAPSSVEEVLTLGRTSRSRRRRSRSCARSPSRRRAPSSAASPSSATSARTGCGHCRPPPRSLSQRHMPNIRLLNIVFFTAVAVVARPLHGQLPRVRPLSERRRRAPESTPTPSGSPGSSSPRSASAGPALPPRPDPAGLGAAGRLLDQRPDRPRPLHRVWDERAGLVAARAHRGRLPLRRRGADVRDLVGAADPRRQPAAAS